MLVKAKQRPIALYSDARTYFSVEIQSSLQFRDDTEEIKRSEVSF